MKKSKKIALCGIIAALSAASMFTSHFPYLTYAIPAVAGLFMMVPLIEVGVFWALGAYVSAAVISLVTGEIQSAILFVAFFGYYPVLKAVIERLKSQTAEWILKLLCFNAAAVVSYFVMGAILSFSLDDLAVWGKYGAFILLALCNIVFMLYDIGISRVASYYIIHLHDRVKRILK